MGRDTGIEIKNLETLGLMEDIPYEMLDGEDLCYWRGFSSFADEVTRLLPKITEYGYRLKTRDVREIIKILTQYLDRKYYEEHPSRWDYDDSIIGIGQDIGKLHWLLDFMQRHPQLDVEFYDSF